MLPTATLRLSFRRQLIKAAVHPPLYYVTESQHYVHDTLYIYGTFLYRNVFELRDTKELNLSLSFSKYIYYIYIYFAYHHISVLYSGSSSQKMSPVVDLPWQSENRSLRHCYSLFLYTWVSSYNKIYIFLTLF